MKLLQRLENNTLGLQIFLAAAGALSLGLGIYRAEVKTVLMKAIYVCLECIGIG